MKRFWILIFFLFPFILAAQSTTKVSHKTSRGWKETYHVLKDNRTIKHGRYELEIPTDIITEGYYKNGEMDSLWVFKSVSGFVKSSGMYKRGDRTGIWEFFDHIGLVEHKYDYSKKKLVYLRDTVTEPKTVVITDNGQVEIKIDRLPIYMEGSGAIMDLLDTNLTYPTEAMEKGIQGKVWISFKVHRNGIAYDFAVESGIGGGCDEEALRVVKMLTGPWVPAVLNEKPITVIFHYPIKFKLM